MAEDAGLSIVHPTRLPEGWMATSVDLRAGDEPRWGLGMLTDEGDFVGLRQQDASIDELVHTYIDEEADSGPEASVHSDIATTWQTWTDSGGDHGYSTEVADDSLLVYGSAPPEDLEAFLGLLTSTDTR